MRDRYRQLPLAELAHLLLTGTEREKVAATAELVRRHGPVTRVLARLFGPHEAAPARAEDLMTGVIAEAALVSHLGGIPFLAALRQCFRERLEERVATYIEALPLWAESEVELSGLRVLRTLAPFDQVIVVCKTRERTSSGEVLLGVDGFLSAEQIAVLYDVSAATVRTRSTRAEQRMRRAAG